MKILVFSLVSEKADQDQGHKGHGQDQRGQDQRSRLWVNVGQRQMSQGLMSWVKVKGRKGQGQRSRSRVKVVGQGQRLQGQCQICWMSFLPYRRVFIMEKSVPKQKSTIFEKCTLKRKRVLKQYPCSYRGTILVPLRVRGPVFNLFFLCENSTPLLVGYQNSSRSVPKYGQRIGVERSDRAVNRCPH